MSLFLFSFSTSIVNYGILFNLEKLSGSIYLNSVYTGLLRYDEMSRILYVSSTN
ncbi:hypothetical protein ANCDUO_02464, partial [Ancylostoma duodenale]